MSDSITIDALSVEAEEADGQDVLLVSTEGFEGPLHMLLDMARRQKVDLRQVSILDLANQYLAFIKEAKARRIDLAADYLLMAAWLAYLKSRLLLPKEEKEGGDVETAEDMAERLAFRLKRLDAMREAAEALQNGPTLDNVVFLRGMPEKPKVIKHSEYDTGVYHLTQAFGTIRVRKEEARPHRIAQQLVLPLEAARQSLKSLVPELDEWRSLDHVRRQVSLPDSELPECSVTASVFSAALELVRDGDVDVKQHDHFTPLYLRGVVRQEGEASHETA
ncbi:MAG: ScpA family protein [Pseudomonadota bacterium]